MEHVVRGQRIGAGAARCRARSDSASVNGANDTEAELLARDGHRLRSQSRGRRSSSVRGRPLTGALAPVDEAGGDGDALLAGEAGAREADRRHREVRACLRGDRHRREHRALREMDFFGAGPAGLLEVADQHRFLPLQRRRGSGCFRRASAPDRSGSRPTSTFAASIAGSSRGRSVVARMFSSAFLANSTSVARSSPPSRVDRLARRVARALPVVAVAHARRLIEQHDDLARAAADARRASAPCGMNGRANAATISSDRRRRAAAAGTSGGCAAAAPTDTGIRRTNISDGKHDHALAFALNQVDQHRNRQRADADQEERSQETTSAFTCGTTGLIGPASSVRGSTGS